MASARYVRLHRARRAVVGAGRASCFYWLLALLCSIGALTAPARAEAPYKNLDANGVDLTDGSFTLNLVLGSIGSGQAELPLVVLDGRGDNWSNYSLSYDSAKPVPFLVSVGGTEDALGTDGESVRATGATVTLSATGYTYRFQNGDVIEFGNPFSGPTPGQNFCGGVAGVSCIAVPLTMSQKGRLTTSFGWVGGPHCPTPETCLFWWRLGSVSNNANYRIGFDYVTDDLASPYWFVKAAARFSNALAAMSPDPTVTYSTSGASTTITTAGGKVWRITVDGQNRIVAVKRPTASVDTMTIGYGANGVTQVTRDGVQTLYARTLAGTTATTVVTDALGHQTTIVSDMTKYRPVEVTDALGHTTRFDYDLVGRPTRVTYPESNRLEYDYDDRGNVVAVRRYAKGSATAQVIGTAEYAATCANPLTCNSPSVTRDAGLHETDYAYDPATGQLQKATAPAASAGAIRAESRYAYTMVAGVSVLTGVSTCQNDAAPACIGTADEVRTTTQYDANLRPTSTSSGAGDGSLTATTAYSYDGVGNVVSVDGPLAGPGDVSGYRWSPDRERVGSISVDPDGGGPLPRRAVRTHYNGDGYADLVELGIVAGLSDADWAGFASYRQAAVGFDANGRAVQTTLRAAGASFGIAQQHYDALGRADCSVVRMDLARAPPFDCASLQSGAGGPDQAVRTVFDAVGRVSDVIGGYLSSTAASRGARSYTANGRLATLTDANGNRTSYEYDGYDRLARTRYPVAAAGAGVSSTTDYEEQFYDGSDNVYYRRLRDGSGIGYAYDALDRVIYKNLPGSEVDTAYGYDLLGRLTGAYRGELYAFGYDALSRLVTQQAPLGTVTSGYDLAGRRVLLKWPDGFFVTYDYLLTGEPTFVREQGSQDANKVLAAYVYDVLGDRTQVVRPQSVTNLTYDPVSRLASLSQNLAGTAADVAWSYGYTGSGQLAGETRDNAVYAYPYGVGTRTYQVNGLNQAVEQGDTAPARAIGYDLRGNVTGIGSQVYGYSSEDLLVSGPGATLDYDALVRLGTVTAGGTATRLLYDRLDRIAEYDAGGSVVRRYVFGEGSDEPVAWYEGSGLGPRMFYHADGRGSVVAVSDGAGGSVATQAYDEDGGPAASPVGTFGYTGQAWLAPLGLWYYKARVYNPAIARFMQSDPIGYRSGMNLYAYVGGDPVNYTDPLGLATETHCGPNRNTTCLPVGGNQPAPEPETLDVVVTAGYRYHPCYDTPGGCFGVGTAGNPGLATSLGLAPDGGGAGGGGPTQRTQTPSPCQAAFLKSQLASRGLPTSQIDSLRFVSGLNAGANAITRQAFGSGATAVTQGSTVYVQPGRFNEVANFRSAIPFEEAYHTSQFASDSGFYSTYGLLSLGGLLSIGDSYKGNLYEAFAQGASQQMFEASKTGMCPRGG